MKKSNKRTILKAENNVTEADVIPNPPKRKKSIKSFIEYPGGDWIISADTSAQIILETIEIMYPRSMWSKIRVLLPGVGLSNLPTLLFKSGLLQLTLLDIEEASIKLQTCNFQREIGHLPPSVKIIKCDVLEEGFVGIEKGSQDIVIDKGFMDVFLRQGSSQAVWKLLQDTLVPKSGLLLIFSIFHSKWKRNFNKTKFESVLYSSVQVRRFSKTRPTVSSFSYPGAYFVVQQETKDNILLSKSFCDEMSPLQDFRAVAVSDLPPDASTM